MCVYTHARARSRACACVCICVYIYIYMFIYIYMYIYEKYMMGYENYTENYSWRKGSGTLQIFTR